VDNARDPTEDGEADVDEEVGVAASLDEDRDGREEECQDVEAHVGSGGRHGDDDVCGAFLCLFEILRSLFVWRKAGFWWSLLAINTIHVEVEREEFRKMRRRWRYQPYGFVYVLVCETRLISENRPCHD
jgi:hypothetical protein